MARWLKWWAVTEQDNRGHKGVTTEPPGRRSARSRDSTLGWPERLPGPIARPHYGVALEPVALQTTVHAPVMPADWLPFLHEIADRADAIALAYFRADDLRVDTKPDASPVSAADRAIEEMARAVTHRRHGELGVFGEEQGEDAGSAGARLIIDPIDSTRNFVRGIPVFATLLAIEQDHEVVAGIASAPALGTRWHAARGAGAFRGDRRIAVSPERSLAHALLFHGNLAPGESSPPPAFAALVARVARTRGFGDFYQHLLVAEGAGEIAIDPDTQPWDIAALQIIVEEAGGRATALSGERSIYAGSFVTSNGPLHQAILDTFTHPT